MTYSLAAIIVLIISSIALSVLYILSVQPVRLGKRMGARSFKFCHNLRVLSTVFEMITVAAYIFYSFYPLGKGEWRRFPWPGWVSILAGILITLPSLYLMCKGMHDAGSETMTPRQEHTMYTGLYLKIRHPQAAGGVFLWLGIAFFLNSPSLALVSLLWFPAYYLFCVYEERDLLLRYGEEYKAYRRKVGMFLPRKKKMI